MIAECGVCKGSGYATPPLFTFIKTTSPPHRVLMSILVLVAAVSANYDAIDAFTNVTQSSVSLPSQNPVILPANSFEPNHQIRAETPLSPVIAEPVISAPPATYYTLNNKIVFPGTEYPECDVILDGGHSTYHFPGFTETPTTIVLEPLSNTSTPSRMSTIFASNSWVPEPTDHALVATFPGYVCDTWGTNGAWVFCVRNYSPKLSVKLFTALSVPLLLVLCI